MCAPEGHQVRGWPGHLPHPGDPEHARGSMGHCCDPTAQGRPQARGPTSQQLVLVLGAPAEAPAQGHAAPSRSPTPHAHTFEIDRGGDRTGCGTSAEPCWAVGGAGLHQSPWLPPGTWHPQEVWALTGPAGRRPSPESATSTPQPQQAEGNHSGQHFIDSLNPWADWHRSLGPGLCPVCHSLSGAGGSPIGAERPSGGW